MIKKEKKIKVNKKISQHYIGNKKKLNKQLNF